MIGQQAFGARLRLQRERQGVSLAAIADSTKIKLSLLDQLERGDVSHWPRGLFRRAYLRHYASAIGTPAESLVAEFVRLFPEDGIPPDEGASVSAPEPMRLFFPETQHVATQRALSSIAGAAAELAAVLAAGVGLSFALDAGVVASSGAAALVYYPLCTAGTGRTLSGAKLKWLVGRVRSGGSAETAEPSPLYLVPRPAPTAQPPAPAPLPLVSVAPEEAPARRSAAV